MRIIVYIFLASAITFCVTSCSSSVRNEDLGNYDPFYLAEGLYVKKGNPYTGTGYTPTYNIDFRGDSSGNVFGDKSPYAMDSIDKRVLPLRSREIVGRLYIYPQRVGNAWVEAVRIYDVLRPPDWRK